MAGRSSTAFCFYFALILHLVLLTECNYGVRYGDRAKRLHIAEHGDSPYRKPLVIDRRSAVSREHDDGDGETSFGRTRRDAPLPEHPNNNPNITTKVRARLRTRSIVRRSPPLSSPPPLRRNSTGCGCGGGDGGEMIMVMMMMIIITVISPRLFSRRLWRAEADRHMENVIRLPTSAQIERRAAQTHARTHACTYARTHSHLPSALFSDC